MKKLGFGLMRLPQTDVSDYENIDLEMVKRMADVFLAEGFTYFDTAYPYHSGNSETAFREAVVKRYPREAFTIADKMPVFQIKSEDELQKIFDEQLERCGVDYFDYYLLHALGKSTYEVSEKLHVFEFVAEKKAEGKVKMMGLSYHDSPELLDTILSAHPEMEFVQLQLNYMDWDDQSIRSRECYEVATQHGKPVIVMEPIKGGSLVNIPEQAEKLFKAAAPDLSIASWAIRFAASHENVMMVLSGMSNEEQLLDNMSYMKDFNPLSEAEQATVVEATEIIRQSIAIPCTGCRYCVDGCPEEIAIPGYFALINNIERFGKSQRMISKVYYENLTQSHGKASDCIECGQCEEHCPQHLSIIDYLKDVAIAFE